MELTCTPPLPCLALLLLPPGRIFQSSLASRPYQIGSPWLTFNVCVPRTGAEMQPISEFGQVAPAPVSLSFTVQSERFKSFWSEGVRLNSQWARIAQEWSLCTPKVAPGCATKLRGQKRLTQLSRSLSLAPGPESVEPDRQKCQNTFKYQLLTSTWLPKKRERERVRAGPI